MIDLPLYSKKELSLRNGQDRDEIWCAYKGYIYQLNKSKLWRGGKHYEHWAGQDLTKEMTDSPHTDNVFDKWTPIGKLIKE